MAGIDSSHEFDVYLSRLSQEESHSYETSFELEKWFAGYNWMEIVDWLSAEDVIQWSTPSQPMRGNEQGPFISAQIDEQVNEFVNDFAAPAQQPMAHDGISYAPNQMNGHCLGESETTEPTSMDCETDFFLQLDESQQMMSEIGCAAVAPQYHVEPMKYAKDWAVRDENTGKIRPPLLYEYLRELLDDPNYAHVASYIDAQKGVFKFHDKDMAARLWQEAKQRNCDSDMTYEKFARAIRHYYDKDIIRRYRAHFTFCFGPNSGFGTTWTAMQNFQ